MDRTALLRGDLLAGLTAAAVVTPQAMAYASIAAVPPQAEIACTLLPAVAYVALGTSRALSVNTNVEHRAAHGGRDHGISAATTRSRWARHWR